MPVFAERITSPSAQDLIDLSKIYDGASAWINASPNSGDQLIGGRFNDRLVCAFVLEDQQDHWQITRLQVRDITRRRGVARQTLQHALKSLELDKPVVVDISQHLYLGTMLRELGFEGDSTLQWAP